MDIFVGNLPQEVDHLKLTELFQPYGTIAGTRIVVDKFSGVSRGFGFVDMPNEKEAQKAISAINGKEIQGNMLKVEGSQRPPHHPVK